MTTSRILEGDLKLNPTTMAVLANLRQAKAEIDDLYAAIADGTGVTQEALEALDVVQHNSTTGGLEVNGSAIVAPVFDWGVTFPLPSALVAGSVVGVSPASFGGTYKTTVPIYLISDGTSYKPAFKQLLFHAPGSAAAPISTGSISVNVVSGTTSTFSLGAVSPSIPADFLLSVNFVTAYMHIIRGATSTGATPAYAVKLSTTDAISGGTAPTIINATETTATAGRKALMLGTAMISADGYLVKSTINMPAGIGASTATADATLSTSTLNYLVAGVASGGTAGDFFDVEAYSLWIE
jgi:hypothetical protein